MNSKIEITQIAKELEDKLNGVDYANLTAYGLDNIRPNEVFVFRVVMDTDEFIASERQENKVYRYINCILSVLSNDVEGVGTSTYNAVISTGLSIAVPLCNKNRENAKIVTAVRNLLSDVLKFTESDVVDLGGTAFNHIIDYSFAETGERAQRDVIGDSITFSMMIVHTYVSLGVSSSSVTIEVYRGGAYHPVAYTRYGFARKTVSEPVLYRPTVSGRNVPVTQNVPSQTQLTLNMDLLTRLDVFDEAIREYVYLGKLKRIQIRVKYPIAFNIDENAAITDTVPYNMVLDVAGINGELGTISSSSVTLVEVIDNAMLDE